MRDTLIAAYLEYVNSYLSVAVWAADNGLSLEHANEIINLARRIINTPHPEA